MGKMLRWTGRLLGGLAVLVAIAAIMVYALSQRRMTRSYVVTVATPRVPADPAAVARGAHVAAIRGCLDCHGRDLAGATFIDAPLFARLSGANLTPAGVGATLTDADWVRAIRHGVASDGRPLLFMPSQEFNGLSESDMGDLLAFLHHAAPVARELPANRVGPVGRLLFLLGKVPLLPAEHIDHRQPPPAVPAAAANAAYGGYLAAACRGCHGDGFSGGHIPGTPPDWPDAANLTPDPSGLAGWSEDDLRRALREGVAKGGRAMDTMHMPVRVTRNLSDVEIGALYAYLRALPARPRGQR